MYWQDASPETLRPLVEGERPGLVTDMDGTLSHIVPRPDTAQITPRCRELLEALRPCMTLVAVVSGRAAADLRARVSVPGVVYVGNHGLERWIDGKVRPMPKAVAYRPAIESALAALYEQQVEGMLVEDKTVTISVHYRQTADPDTVGQQFLPMVRRIAQEEGLNVFQGRRLFELRPPVPVNKGTALEQLVEEYGLDAAIYLGDDTTDVDALTAARRMRHEGTCYALGLGVESDGVPVEVEENADLLAGGVSGVEAFLAWLLSARKASSSCA